MTILGKKRKYTSKNKFVYICYQRFFKFDVSKAPSQHQTSKYIFRTFCQKTWGAESLGPLWLVFG